MANRYWVGVAGGTWNTTSTTNWSATSGGAGGASVPTSADDVFFDQAATYTVTLSGSGLVCRDLTVSAGNVTFVSGTSPALSIQGSMSLVASTVWNSNLTITFVPPTTGKTITTNGVYLPGSVTFSGTSGGYTLGSALSIGGALSLNAGTLNTSTSNYSITASSITVASSSSVVLTLNGSTVNLSSNATPLSYGASGILSAGTSTINCTSTSGCTFSGGGKTYYNVRFTGAATSYALITISGGNAFNDLSFTSPAAETLVEVSFVVGQAINGLFSGSGSQANRRILYRSSSTTLTRNLTLKNSPATISNADFRDIVAVTNPIIATTGGGNCGGTTNITYPASKTVYWNLAGGQSWSANGWATTPNGTPAIANFPLAQDTAIFTNTGAVGSITIDSPWQMGTVDMSARTSAMMLTSNSGFWIYGSWLNGTGVTLSGSGVLTFAGRTTQYLFGNGVAFSSDITLDGANPTLQLDSAVTLLSTRTFALTRGTLVLSGYTLTAGAFSSSFSSTRAIQFNGGNITLGGTGTVWNTSSTTLFTVTGTPDVNITNATSTGVSIFPGSPAESASMNFNFTAGSYALVINTGNVRSLNFTGFSGSLNNVARTIYGDLTLSPTMSLTAGTETQTFGSTSATPRTITTNGKLLDFPVLFNGVGGRFVLQDAMTVGSTRITTLDAGTLDLNGKTLTTGSFNTSGNVTRSIAFGTGNITITGSGTLWSGANITGLTTSGTQTVNVVYSGFSSSSVSVGTATESDAISFNFMAGGYALGLNAGNYRSLNFTGFSGTLANYARVIYGDLILSANMTVSAGTSAQTFAATSGTQTIVTNGKIMDFPVTFNGIGGTRLLGGALTMGSTRTLTLTSGTFNTAGYNVSVSVFAGGSGSDPRSLILGSSTVTVSGTSTAFSIGTAPTALSTITVSAASSTLVMTGSSPKTAALGDKTWGTVVQAGAGTLTISGNTTSLVGPTISNLTNTVQPTTVLFTGGTTYTFGSFSLSGTAGNLVTVGSTNTSKYTLIDSSGSVNVSYCNISYSNATGGATWNAFTSSGNVDGGNNTGWTFTNSALTQTSNFIMFFLDP